MTPAVMQAQLGYTSESRWLRYARSLNNWVYQASLDTRVEGFTRNRKIIALGRYANAAKWISFILVAIGFRLDLLGS